MNPLGILLAFAFLGLVALSGAGMTAFGIWRMQRHTPHAPHSTIIWSRIVPISLNGLMIVIGLLLVIYVAVGTYRVVWGS